MTEIEHYSKFCTFRMAENFDVPDGGGVLHRLMSKMSVRHKKDEMASDFTYVSHRNDSTAPVTHVRQSSDPTRSNSRHANRPRVNLNKSDVKFNDIYKKPLSPDDDTPKRYTFFEAYPLT